MGRYIKAVLLLVVAVWLSSICVVLAEDIAPLPSPAAHDTDPDLDPDASLNTLTNSEIHSTLDLTNSNTEDETPEEPPTLEADVYTTDKTTTTHAFPPPVAPNEGNS